jgi:dolichol-phosphate mannosyltransferase
MDGRRAKESRAGTSRLAGLVDVVAAPMLQRAPVAEPEPAQRTEVSGDETTTGAEALTVVVPTRNESGNIGELVQRLDVAVRGREARLVVVDESDDDTAVQARFAGRRAELSVHVRSRSAGRTDRRSQARSIVEGLHEAAGRWAVVMDADLQHPPELVPRLVEAGEAAGADVVVASRLQDGPRRRSGHGLEVGRALALRGLAGWLLPQLSTLVSDPASGFFAVRPAAVDLTRLSSSGPEVLLDLLADNPDLGVTEVPFLSDLRKCGHSKRRLGWTARWSCQVFRLAHPASGHITIPARRLRDRRARRRAQPAVGPDPGGR